MEDLMTGRILEFLGEILLVVCLSFFFLVILGTFLALVTGIIILAMGG